jgi:pyruvate dehydrogenase E2 component (dihydrolipoyllysine-residue acetyltransferase)
MPSLGADMEAGTLVEWMIKPGDSVKRGDVVAVVETQKGAIEIEIFETGQVERILVDVGGKVPVGTPLARIHSEQEAKVGPAEVPQLPEVPARGPVPAAPAAQVPAAPKPQIVVEVETRGRVRASPVARRLAAARGIDLAAITGSGPLGAIILYDLERSGGVIAPPVERKRTVGLDAMRAAIAAAMARSKREIPHYYLEHQVDVTGCEEFLSRINAGRPPDNRLLMGALLVKSVAFAARRVPVFNGFHQNGEFKPSPRIHTGVAIAIRGGGLAAPAIHDSDQLTVDELMVRMRDLVQRVRAGRIRSSEMADPTITVSSLGERGVEALYGIIYPPQVAIVGFGKIVARPWIVDGSVVARSVVTITLAADHRASDGHAGALFLAEIGKLLHEPDRL